MNQYAHYSPATDTHELPTVLRGPFFERATVEIPLLDLRPAVTRYARPSRLARLAHRVRNSEAADHLRASASLAFWPTVAASGLLIAVVTRGDVMTWTGLESVDGAR